MVGSDYQASDGQFPHCGDRREVTSESSQNTRPAIGFIVRPSTEHNTLCSRGTNCQDRHGSNLRSIDAGFVGLDLPTEVGSSPSRKPAYQAFHRGKINRVGCSFPANMERYKTCRSVTDPCLSPLFASTHPHPDSWGGLNRIHMDRLYLSERPVSSLKL